MTTAPLTNQELQNGRRLSLLIAITFALITTFPLVSFAQTTAPGKQGLKKSTKQKSSKKFALKPRQKLTSKKTAVVQLKPKAKVLAKVQAPHKTKFLISKKTIVAPVATRELAKAFSSNQQNQLLVRTSTAQSKQPKTEAKSRNLPSLLPMSNDSQRAANMLEADSGVHSDEGYTRTQIVDAPSARKPAAVAPRAPERVAVTFEHESK